MESGPTPDLAEADLTDTNLADANLADANLAEANLSRATLTGANLSTECIRNPLEWMYYQSDSIQVRDIHRRFGTRPLHKFPLTTIFRHKVWLPYVKGIKTVRPLNYGPYIKEEAVKLLVDKFGWQPYPQKHFESRFTRFYEGYWLPTKFGYDKRRAHFSSLILTGQMTRDDALARIATRACSEDSLAEDFEYIATQLDLTVPELKAIMAGPNKSYKDYSNAMTFIDLGTKVLRALGVQRAIIR